MVELGLPHGDSLANAGLNFMVFGHSRPTRMGKAWLKRWRDRNPRDLVMLDVITYRNAISFTTCTTDYISLSLAAEIATKTAERSGCGRGLRLWNAFSDWLALLAAWSFLLFACMPAFRNPCEVIVICMIAFFISRL